jgi:hypothetical membrane protein
MGGVNRNRLRWGAIAWLLTLQFFVVETLAQFRFEGPYSRVDDVVSVLGGADSAARQLMNASFVVQGALILAGALLLRPALPRGAAQVARALLAAAAMGALLVGVFPLNGNATLHAIGAGLYFVGGGLGLIALAYAVRPRSEALGTALALLGLAGTAATVFFLTGVTSYLGEGGTERVAAYVLPIGLALSGATLWLLGRRDTGPTRQEERELRRDEQAERDRRRDDALTAAVPRPSTGGTSADGAAPTTEDDERDPWAAPPRRGD